MKFKKFDFSLNIKNCFIKDYSFNKLGERFPSVKPLIFTMKGCLQQEYRFYLVDLIVKEYIAGEKTCPDVRYHVDGDFTKDNQYCIWLSGENRTIFSKEKISISDLKGERSEQNEILERNLFNKPCFEIPQNTIFVYDSLHPHKGVICKKPGKRILARVLGTNYIKPKNFIKFY